MARLQQQLDGLLGQEKPRTRTTTSEILNLQIQLWQFRGVRDHDLQLERLIKVADVYKSIGVVPTHYHFPEFYCLDQNN